jgi:hypothetical protein
VAPLSAFTPDGPTASSAGLQIISGYDPLVLRHYQSYIELVEFNHPLESHPGVWTELSAVSRPDLLAALNVLYVVSPTPADLPPDDYELVKRFDAQPQFRFYKA